MISNQQKLLNEFAHLLDQYRCCVDQCQNRQDHWTIDHICQRCSQPGHSDTECQSVEEQRLLRIISKLQIIHFSTTSRPHPLLQKPTPLIDLSQGTVSLPSSDIPEQELYPNLAAWGFI